MDGGSTQSRTPPPTLAELPLLVDPALSTILPDNSCRLRSPAEHPAPEGLSLVSVPPLPVLIGAISPPGPLTPTALIIILVAVNVASFLLFRTDKRRSVRKAWRIPERTLHLSCLAGGVIGAWAGVRVFRHKTQKVGFLAKLFVTSLMAIVFWLWLFGVIAITLAR